jgi:hypothetical protein
MRRNFGYLAFLLVFLLATQASGYTEQDCISCHDTKNTNKSVYVDIDTFRGTVHGESLSCVDCHTGISEENHTKGKECKKVDCSLCHEQRNLHAANKSVKCSSCHPPHLIYRKNDVRSSVHGNNLKKTCGQCHIKQTEQESFWSSFKSYEIVSHPKQDFSINYSKYNCIGCHQGKAAHGEKQPVDHQDCYKCHMPLAQNKFVLGYIHQNIYKDNKLLNSAANYTCILIAVAFTFFMIRSIIRFIKS